MLNVVNGLLAIVKTSEIGYVIQTRLLRAIRERVLFLERCRQAGDPLELEASAAGL